MDLTIGNVKTKLIRYTIPLLLTMIISQIYVMADSIIVSRLLGNEALAYMAPSSQVLSIFQSVYYGITVAISIIVANLKGSKLSKELKNS